MTYQCTEEQFLKDIETHEMRVIRDSDVDRHIRFRRPGTICYGFDLITWPGHLCITGDMGTYVFSRVEDMFCFFRYSDEYKKHYPDRKLHINRGYWAEKLLAVDTNGPAKEFSSDKFVQCVTEDFVRWCRDYPEKRHDFKEIWRELKYSLFGAEHEYDAIRSAMDFRCCGFDMQDFWETDCKEYTYRFEWCLYAIVWGIENYDKATIPAVV